MHFRSVSLNLIREISHSQTRMQKFTIFTIILTIVIIVVVSEIVVNEYLPSLRGSGSASLELTLPESLDLSKTIRTNSADAGLNNHLGSDVGATSVLGSESGAESDPEPAFVLRTTSVPEILPEISEAVQPVIQPVVQPNEYLPVYETVYENDSTSSGLEDFEDENFVSASNNVYIREEQIKSAGFIGAYLEKEPHGGHLYKTIFIDDLRDVEIDKTVVRTKDALLAKVYVFKAGINSNINELYQLIKMRASEGLGIDVNETNEFGIASFYLNDANRSGTTFLTVRIAGYIYGFSYPKEYHSQIKNLIQLIEWELG